MMVGIKQNQDRRAAQTDFYFNKLLKNEPRNGLTSTK